MWVPQNWHCCYRQWHSLHTDAPLTLTTEILKTLILTSSILLLYNTARYLLKIDACDFQGKNNIFICSNLWRKKIFLEDLNKNICKWKFSTQKNEYCNGCPINNYPLSIFKISPLLSLWLKLFLLSKDSTWNSLQNRIWLRPTTVLDIFEKRRRLKTYKQL